MIPLLLAGAGLDAGSMIANMFAQHDISKARAKAIAAENARQGALDTEISGINAGARNRYAGFGEGAAADSKGLGDFLGGLSAGPQPGVMPASTSAVTNGAIDREHTAAQAFGTQQAGALGTQLGFGDYLGSLNRMTARDASQVGELGNFKQGSAGVSQYELQAANQKGGTAKFLGDLLRLGGNVALGSGLQGSFAPAAASPWAARITG